MNSEHMYTVYKRVICEANNGHTIVEFSIVTAQQQPRQKGPKKSKMTPKLSQNQISELNYVTTVFYCTIYH